MATTSLSFTVTETIQASNDAVWAVLADFGNEHRWTQTLRHCERDTPHVAVGTARICTLPRPLMGRTVVRERLVEFEPGRALAYQLEGPAGPFLEAASRWSTEACEDGTTALTVEGRFIPARSWTRVLLWPIVKPMLRRLTRQVAAELGQFVRSGS